MALSINEQARMEANLRLLQKSDRSISSILQSATHVVLYHFQQMSQSWEKSNVEGSLFLTTRSPSAIASNDTSAGDGSSLYWLYILNRHSPDSRRIASAYVLPLLKKPIGSEIQKITISRGMVALDDQSQVREMMAPGTGLRLRPLNRPYDPIPAGDSDIADNQGRVIPPNLG